MRRRLWGGDSGNRRPESRMVANKFHDEIRRQAEKAEAIYGFGMIYDRTEVISKRIKRYLDQLRSIPGLNRSVNDLTTYLERVKQRCDLSKYLVNTHSEFMPIEVIKGLSATLGSYRSKLLARYGLFEEMIKMRGKIEEVNDYYKSYRDKEEILNTYSSSKIHRYFDEYRQHINSKFEKAERALGNDSIDTDNLLAMSDDLKDVVHRFSKTFTKLQEYHRLEYLRPETKKRTQLLIHVAETELERTNVDFTEEYQSANDQLKNCMDQIKVSRDALRSARHKAKEKLKETEVSIEKLNAIGQDLQDVCTQSAEAFKELLTRRLEQDAFTRIEEAYNSVLHQVPGNDAQERLERAKDLWKDRVRHYLNKGKGSASEQVSGVMRKAWENAVASQGEMQESFESLRDAATFNRIKHILLFGDINATDEDKKRAFDALSLPGKSLAEKYVQFTDEITDFEHQYLRSVSIDEKASIIRNGQKIFLNGITSEQVKAVFNYTAWNGSRKMNAFCRYNGDHYIIGSSTSMRLEPQYHRALAAIPEALSYSDYGEMFYALMQDNRDVEEVRHSIEGLDSLAMHTFIPENVVVKKDIVMERIVPFLRDPQGERTFQFKEGLFWQDEAFVSTSIKLTGIYHPPYASSVETAAFFIKLPKGSPGIFLGSISAFEFEVEILLPRNSAIEIEKILTLDKSQLSENDQRILSFLPKYLIHGKYCGIGNTRFLDT